MMITMNTTGDHTPAVQRARQQAEELEGVFLNTLVKEMFAGIKTDGAFGGGFGEETWRSIQSEELANAMAKAGGLGIADQMMGDLLAMQEAAQNNNPMNGAAIR